MSVAREYILHGNSDKLGAIASSVCAIHCMATPFLFVARSCSAACCSETPIWWRIIDIIFLVVSFIAIYFSARKSTKSLVRYGLWISWVLLALIILNDFYDVLNLPHWLIYIPASSLIILHIYNLKYCKCRNDKCCVTNE